MSGYRKTPPDFEERLRQYVADAGGLVRVSTNTGINQSTLSRWINGTNTPSLHHLCMLSLYFETTPNVLLGVAKSDGPEARRLGLYEEWKLWRVRRRQDRAGH